VPKWGAAVLRPYGRNLGGRRDLDPVILSKVIAKDFFVLPHLGACHGALDLPQTVP